MKKIKVMLLSLALFAVVGGALAFKAKFQDRYCTAATIAGVLNTDLFCINPVFSKIDPLGNADFVATTTYNFGCPAHLKCTTTALRLIED